MTDAKTKQQELLFSRWCDQNIDALKEMLAVAQGIIDRGEKLSAKYLIERQRYEGLAPMAPVEYVDERGHRRAYSVNNTHSPLLARLLKRHYPDANIELRRSKFDHADELKDEIEQVIA